MNKLLFFSTRGRPAQAATRSVERRLPCLSDHQLEHDQPPVRKGANELAPSLTGSFGIILAAGLLVFTRPSQALTIQSGPFFTPSSNAPLSGVLQLTTDTPSRVSVSVNDGMHVWEREFYDYQTEHSLPLFGFRPARTNDITVTVQDRSRNMATADQPLVFTSDRLPSDFPNLTLLESDPARMEPGYSLFRVEVHQNTYAYTVIVDSAGEVVWYSQTPSTADVRQLENGDLFMPSRTSFVEMDLLGNTVHTWNVPTSGLPVNAHDGVPTSHGTILYLQDALLAVTNDPITSTNEEAYVSSGKVVYQKVVELSATNAAVLNTWSPINVLDPRRSTYLNNLSQASGLPDLGWDTEHSNAVIEDPSDDSLIVSMRDQNAVVKFSRSTGQLRWILGPRENWGSQWQPYLLTPVGTPFAWQYGQHAPILTTRGTLILYDDGNFRASPSDTPVPDANNYSRAVEYSINEKTMQVSQVWQYGSTNAGQWLYTGYEGNAEPEPKTGNVLIDFSAVSYLDGVALDSYGPGTVMARFKEVTHDAVPQVVFDLAITMYDQPNSPYLDCTVYRVRRIADLYAHPAVGVMDLTVSNQAGVPRLEFSGDDFRTFTVEASANLLNWEKIGAPVEDPENPGTFSFEEVDANGSGGRFYRIVTH